MKEAILLELRTRNYKNENDVKTAVKYIFRKYDQLKFFAIAQSMYSNIGVSDFFACYRGYAIAVEVKHEDNEPTGPQIRFLNAVADAGGMAICVWEYNLEQLIEALDYVSTLPFAGSQESTLCGLTFGLSDKLDTRSSYREYETG